ncbi:MAG: LuxR C-terminal-related transcriptional regulator [Pseudomonadota bacterium]
MDNPTSPESLIERFAGRFPVHSMRRVRLADGTFRYAFVSPAVRQSFGLDAKALVEAPAVDHAWVHEDDRARFIAALHQSADTLTSLDEEVRVVCPDGTLRWVRSLGDPERQADGTVVWDGVALDITDRREALRRVEQAMSVARAAEVAASTAPQRERIAADLAALSVALGEGDLASARAACANLHRAFGLPEPTPRPAERATLTARQTEISALVGAGRTNREIAKSLGLTEGTVKLHISRILRRLGLRNRTALSIHINGRAQTP